MQGLFLKPSSPSYPNALPPHLHFLWHTHPHIHMQTGFCVKESRCKWQSSPLPSLPRNPPPALLLTVHFKGVFLYSASCWEPCHFTHKPFPFWHKLGHDQSVMGPAQHGDLSVPTSAARPTVCFSAAFLGPDKQLPYWGQVVHDGGNPTLASPSLQSKDRKEVIMFKHPHYEPQLSHCGSPSIKGFNRWRRRGSDRES